MNVFPPEKEAALIACLKHCPLFENVADSSLTEIASISIRKNLLPGEYVFYEGKPAQGFFIVLGGAIKVHRVSVSGKEQVIEVVNRFESFAEESLFSEWGYSADACAIQRSRVLLIHKAEFLALLRRNPQLALAMFKSMSTKFNRLISLLDDLTLKDVKTRLAGWLVRNCPDPTSQKPYCIRLPMSKRLLALELGTIAETFSRTLARFRRQKLLSVHGSMLILHSPAKMARLARCN